ncbi:hypothetical protein DWB85_02490 [Seongchinamella sediminis]|uniref:Uncharacterized protein n=1 Tax=Seongchinamella sediminis TaxID=2283635 RepID=A0A3L7E4M6_9GAMM|nr:hypothetical protein [Seongchinamella sediminis]RLQ23442.1 hypothetical protein DWB85_02490 [Seongchinamella sediminis]
MHKLFTASAFFATFFAQQAASLSLAPEEFVASRQLACVLAAQSLGYLSEKEYGARTHTVLDGFDEPERDNILAKALGYMDGLMFAIDDGNPELVNERLRSYVQSHSCERSDYHQVTVSL